MLRRIPRRGGFWQGITGAPLAVETDTEAAIREVWEETGFAVSDSLVNLGVEYDYSISAETAKFRAYGPDVETIHVVSFGGEVTGDTDPRLDASEHDAFAWSSYGEAAAMLDWPVEQDAVEPRRRALRTGVLGRTRRQRPSSPVERGVP